MTVAAIGLHIIGLVVWVGGLMYQTHVLLPAARRGRAEMFADVARRGRPATWTAVAVVVLTGFYNVTLLGPGERVMQSGAGVLLAGKFILVIAAISIAGQRDFVQLPRLSHTIAAHDDPASVLRMIALQDRLVLLLALIAIYLGVTISRM